MEETKPEAMDAAAAAEPVEQAQAETTPEVQAAETEATEAPEVTETMEASDLFGSDEAAPAEQASTEDSTLKAVLEAVIYVTEEPLTLDQIAAAVDQPKEKITALLAQLEEEYARPDRGIFIREVAGGYKMGTKPEHHEAIRTFVKKMKSPLKLSLAALETLAVIAYKQPITAPEVQEVRGVQGGGVLKTLIDRKLISPAGRKNVVGKPILYKTTKEFLLQFGLKDLAELPTLKEFEELRRLAFPDDDQQPMLEPQPETEPQAEAKPPEQETAEPAAEESTSATQAS